MLSSEVNKRIKLLLLFTIFIVGLFHAQTGNYFIRNYTPAQISASGEQNWGMAQDKEGRLYLANNSGVYINDGKSWTLLLLPNNSAALSIKSDDQGVIYVGGSGEFGYIFKNDTGSFRYKSLSASLKEKEFESVWSIHCIGSKTYFCANAKFFEYSSGKIKVYNPREESEGFHTFFAVEKKLIIREKNVGFEYLSDEGIKFIKGSEGFADKRVYAIIPYKDNLYWAFCREDGVYLIFFNKEDPSLTTFTKVKSPIDKWCVENDVFNAEAIGENLYAIGSQKDGLKIVDDKFNTLQSINTNTDLLDDGVFSIFLDKTNNIWLSLANGVCFMETNLPISKWTKNNGVAGSVEKILRFENILFVATSKGLKKLDKKTNSFTQTEISEACWDLLVIGDELLIGSDHGLYSYKKGKYTLLFEVDAAYSLFIDESILYIGARGSLLRGLYKDGKFTLLNEYPKAPESRSVSSESNGRIMFGTSGDGVFYFNNSKDTVLNYIGKDDGLPTLTENYVFSFNDKLLIGTESGIFAVEENNNKIFLDRPKNLNPFAAKASINKASQIQNEIWLSYSEENELHKQVLSLGIINPSSSALGYKTLKRLRGFEIKQFYLDSSSVYIATNLGVFKYDITATVTESSINTFISKIKLRNDTLNVFENIDIHSQTTLPSLSFNYFNSDLDFYPAASDYIDEQMLQFCWYLQNYEDTFCIWTNTDVIHYKGLHEGNYVLHIKSRNILGKEGNTLSIPFRILPPWYRTAWAYISYFILFVIVVYVIVKLNTKRLRAQNVKLENTITERTKTIAHQMVEIEHKNKEITDSINYAKGIQDSILPDIKDIITTWKDTFIYFQPKDIVSGDFFWYKKINDHEFLIACADCTGHGVPGGFMSMICSDKLHDSAKDFTEPKDILFGTNNGVKTTLKQQVIVEGKSKDGMEICLLKVNTQTQEVSYSGANRLLWIVDGVTKELTEIKPTKASIASFTEFNFEYQQHDFKLKKGDIIYATSDGYPDQFGGPEGKKYMSKKMKAFVISICHLPMNEQHDLLKAEINDWMLGHEQVDDLLVIGVRL